MVYKITLIKCILRKCRSISTHAVLEARALNIALWPFPISVYNTNVMNKDIFSLNSVLTKVGNLILAELDNTVGGNPSCY